MSIKSILRPVVHQSRAIGRYARRKLALKAPPPVGREPAFDPETRAWFLARIETVDAYVEYGAGASSLLMADAGVPSVSIESDADYAQAVRDAMPPAKPGSINEIQVADIGPTEDWGAPLWIMSPEASAKNWAKYPDAGPLAVDTLGRFPDLVLVDGRFRVACCLAMARAAKRSSGKTQILFDDYTLREQYFRVENILGEPKLIGRSALFEVDGRTLDTDKLDAAYSLSLRDYR